MPSRNVIKIDIADGYYHVYARGHSKSEIFIDDADYNYFTKLFARYLSKKPTLDKHQVPYPHLYGCLDLLCYCLMRNHFHLLLYQHEEGAMQKLMRGVMGSYSRYFNNKYNRTGSLFESRYKASLITSQQYVEHISRYIHLNRKQWQTTPYSSIGYYLSGQKAEWVHPDAVLAMFNNDREEYKKFLADYVDYKDKLDEIKYELANTIL